MGTFIDVEIEMSPELKKMLSTWEVKGAMKEAIAGATKETFNETKAECPVDTGRLQKSHFFKIEPEEGRIGTDCPYKDYVINGTYKMRANPYNERAVAKVAKRASMGKQFAMNWQRRIVGR